MIIEKVRDTIGKYDLLRSGDTVLVAVSGGPDSLALLYCLRVLSKELRLRLNVAHFDHRLRPGSLREAEFVGGIAKGMGLPFYSGGADVLKRRGGKGSLEEAAREARLDFLGKLAKKIKADKVALGHNMDDQAETVLMRILRGSGLAGLSGIAALKELNGRVFIRPLIGVSRSEIERYLRSGKIKPFRDPSNSDEKFLRNKLRLKLVPLLEKEYNPRIKEALNSLAENAAYDYDYLLSRARTAAVNSSGSRLKVSSLLRMHPSLRRMVIRLRINSLQGSTRRITFKHMEEIEDMLVNRPCGSIVDLPKGYLVEKRGIFLCFRKRIGIEKK
ncbi:MAG: tRNA lysidine(34) synthetase TilS [Candidatus Omnitrophota bacterium]|jgi:tRNA(Ile)-lysidine synthase